MDWIQARWKKLKVPIMPGGGAGPERWRMGYRDLNLEAAGAELDQKAGQVIDTSMHFSISPIFLGASDTHSECLPKQYILAQSVRRSYIPGVPDLCHFWTLPHCAVRHRKRAQHVPLPEPQLLRISLVFRMDNLFRAILFSLPWRLRP